MTEPTRDLVFGVGLMNAQDVTCYGTNTDVERLGLPELAPRGTVRLSFPRLDLIQGTYSLDVAAPAKDGRAYDDRTRAAAFRVRHASGEVGVFRPPHDWQFISREAAR